MSRLYAWIESDTRKTVLTTGACESLKVTVNFGSRDDSKRLLTVAVKFPKNQDTPSVEIMRKKP